ncbi:MAG: FtsX-like permease family protein, partial [Bacteroidaceae bacterium]|nr:FtsX-like permease family protein [Bacteroidaceae bacterium]
AESMVLTVLAGMSGIIFAVLLLQGVESVLLAQGTEASFQVSFSTAIGSTVALCLLGSAAGIAPSLRALAIKPIEAIRDE